MGTYLRYWVQMIRCAFSGTGLYYAWMAALTLVVIAGGYALSLQLDEGLVVTNMSDQVSWGAYIANFTYLVGIAAAAVILVVPTYVFHHKDLKEVVLIAELMAASAMIMCLLFVTVDLGHPERFLHLAPGIGRLNFPRSILAWDVIVLQVYLLINLHVPGYLLYKKYLGSEPTRTYYLPLVFLSILWAVSIHTVTAFLYSGFGGRPFWNSAILAPRFLVSAFASGPSLLIIVFAAVKRFGGFPVKDSVFEYLRKVVMVAIPANFFLLGCEVFKDFYTDSTHVASMEYLFFGLYGHARLVPYIWTGLALNLTALIVFATPRLRQRRLRLAIGAFLCVVGVWVEKGMGLIVPGFLPTPMGDLVEYTPSAIEIGVCMGIWALGAALFTVMAKVAIAIMRGDLRAASSAAPRLSAAEEADVSLA